jgi:hypothetical protein
MARISSEKGIQNAITKLLTPFATQKPKAEKKVAPKFWKLPNIDTDYYFSTKELNKPKEVVVIENTDIANGPNWEDIEYLSLKKFKQLTPGFLVVSENGSEFVVTKKQLTKKTAFDPNADDDEAPININLSRANITDIDWYLRFYKTEKGEFRVGCQRFTLADIASPAAIQQSLEARYGIRIDTTTPFKDMDGDDNYNARVWRVRYISFVAAIPFIKQIHNNLHGIKPKKKTAKKAARKATRRRK